MSEQGIQKHNNRKVEDKLSNMVRYKHKTILHYSFLSFSVMVVRDEYSVKETYMHHGSQVKESWN